MLSEITAQVWQLEDYSVLGVSMRQASHGLSFDTSDLSIKCAEGAAETSGGDGEGSDSNLDA